MLLCEPYYWGMRLAVMNLTVEWQQRKRRWKLVRSHSQLLNSNTAKENGKVSKAVRAQHDKVVTYVNAPDRHVDQAAVRGTVRRRGRARSSTSCNTSRPAR